MGGVDVSIAVPPLPALPPAFSLIKPDFVPTVPGLRAIREKHIKHQCNLMGLLSPVVSEVANLGLGLASPPARVIVKSPATDEGLFFLSAKRKRKKKKADTLNQVVTKRGRNNGDDDESEEFSMSAYMKMVMVEREHERKEEQECCREEA